VRPPRRHNRTGQEIEMPASLTMPIGVFGLGLLIAGTAPAFAQQGVPYPTVDVQQIPGNISSIGQTGSANAASVEQQAILGVAYANSAQSQQNGTGGSASVTQQGQQNSAVIVQSGVGDKVSAEQYGAGLGVQINQYGNGASIGVTQSGAGTNGAPIIIKQF
jgi:minor curlin subunit